MAFDDLDLDIEYEDDEGPSKNKKNEAVPVDIELKFVSPDMTKSRPALINPKPSVPPPPPAGASVSHLQDARKTPSLATSGSSALRTQYHSEETPEEIAMLREEVKEAKIRAAVAEFKTEFLSELLGDTKLMQHKIEQLLIRINAKHPDMKQEVLMIKKILADFSAKKRK